MTWGLASIREEIDLEMGHLVFSFIEFEISNPWSFIPFYRIGTICFNLLEELIKTLFKEEIRKVFI